MIRIVVQTEVAQFFNGIDLRFHVRQGNKVHEHFHRMTLHELLNTTLIDAAFEEAKRVMHAAIAEHQRDCASAEPVR